MFILIVVAGTAWAQSPLDSVSLEGLDTVLDLDFSEASLHQAGPDSFYVRGVGIGDSTYSLTFAQDVNGVWNLTDLNPESDNILPERTVLDFASLTAVDGQTIKIDGVFVDGDVYAGTLKIGEDADVTLAGSIETGTIDAVNQARALALAQLVVAESADEFQAELDRQKAELQATIANLEAERDGYKSERDALEQTRDELVAERDSLAAQLAEMPETETLTIAGITVDPSSPLTGEQVTSLLKERNELAGSLVGVGIENNALRDRNRTLAEQIAELQAENEQLLSDLADMNDEVERLTELVEAYRSVQGPSAGSATTSAATDTGATGQSEAEVTTESAAATSEAATTTAAPVWSIPGDYLRKSDLEAAAAQVTAELKSLEGRVAELESAANELASLEVALRTGVADGIPKVAAPEAPGSLPGTGTETAGATEGEAVTTAESAAAETTPPAASASVEAATRTEAASAAATAEVAARLADVSAQLAALVELNESLRREKLELENRILTDILSDGFIAMMRERMTETVGSGFRGSDPDVGTWSITPSSAIQTDSDAFFAKLAVPARQTDKPMLYSFRARSLDPEGWVGLGLHFFVSDVELRRGYGMGRSLLVWLTRDPDVYKTRYTYLQLYRSDDDINMGRVLDAVIEEPISRLLNIEILYEPENQYLTVAINGEDKVRYRTWFGIDSGVEIAFRSLGAAEFTDFRILTEPAESASASEGLIAW